MILAVWALTGAPNAWPVWPLLGLGLIVALDAWRVLGIPPTRRSDLDGEPTRAPSAGAAAVRATAGKLAIVNLFLVGIWVASGAATSGPPGRMLGSALAMALKALPLAGTDWTRARAGRALVAPALRLFVATVSSPRSPVRIRTACSTG